MIGELHNIHADPLFVLATDHDQFAVKAFESEAMDYILKPFDDDRLRKSVYLARRILPIRAQEPLETQIADPLDNKLKDIVKISVLNKGHIKILDPGQIIFCKAQNKGITVRTIDRFYTLSGLSSLDVLEDKLISQSFFRVHRS